MMNRKFVHLAWIGAVMVSLLAGLVLGLRSGDVTVFGREHVWSVETGTEGGQECLVRGRSVKRIHEDMNKLVFAFNKVFEEAEAPNLGENETRLELPHLRIQGVENGVAQVEVANSDYLSRRMGASGARGYLASATYTLTECPAISAVNFLFPEGGHAAPGTFMRASFADYPIIFSRKQDR